MDASRQYVLAPTTVFGGDVAERVTAGDMEGSFTGTAKRIFKSSWQAQASITGAVETGSVHGGLSAQSLIFSTTSDGTNSFAQQLNGLDTDNDYGATAYLNLAGLSSYLLYNVVLRVGPNSGGSDFQGSVTASSVATAGYEKLELSWSNTASSTWLWITAIALTGSMTAGVTADDISVRSASAGVMDACTATNFMFNGSPFYSMVSPDGIPTVASGSTFVLQVNNSNLFDESKAYHYVNPTMLGIKSVADKANQPAAIDPNFESNWIDYADYDSSTYVTGIFRWFRFKYDGGFTGSASAFKVYFWNDRLQPMI